MEFTEKEVAILTCMFLNMQSVINLAGENGDDGITVHGDYFTHNDLFYLAKKLGIEDVIW